MVEVFGPAECAFEARCNIGRNVFAVGIAAGKGEAEVGVALDMRNLIEQADALLEQAVGAAHRSRLLAAEEPVARDIGQHARADAGLAVGTAGDSGCGCARAVVLRLPGLRLKAEAVGQRPAPRFDGLDQHGFLGRVAGGIHDRGVHFIEEREGVEIALRSGERVLVERIAGMHGDGPRHRLRARALRGPSTARCGQRSAVLRRYGRPHRPCRDRRARAAARRSRPPDQSRGSNTP